MSLSNLFLMLKGSSKSGNFGHGGIPGYRGGSTSKGGKGIAAKPNSEKSYVDPFDNLEQTDKELTDYYNLGGKCGKDFNCRGVNDYIGTGKYRPVNNYLRQGKTNDDEVKVKEVKTIVKGLDEVIEKSPRLNKNMKLYRGVKYSNISDLKEGDVVEDKGFVSTTLNKNKATGWSGSMVEIRVPKGAKGIYVNGITDRKEEKEFILGRNQKFKVLKNSGNSTVLELVL